ncbi:hypothetical protein GCM10023091_32070 [Ravibacter arvi]|uniref:HEPN domain-containing protein n=2 Tax=Ravibacter arvi TaxID=2051041 RepID=A0ABP8M4U6_9BACT
MLSNSISYDHPHIEAMPGGQMYFFENLIAMIEAVYLTNRPSVVRVDKQPEEGEAEIGKSAVTGSDENLANRLVAAIVESVPADAIFLLKDAVTLEISNLVVFIENKEQNPISDFRELIRERISPIAPDTVNVFTTHYFKSVTDRKDALYFTLALEGAQRIYLKEGQEFTVPALPAKFSDRVWLVFESFSRKAKSFHTMAKGHVEKGENELTTFFCHQACELSLTALLYAMTGYRDKTHHIGRRLGQARLLNPKLSEELFGSEMLVLLEQAYVKSRYNAGFRVSEEQAADLVEKTGQLIVLVEETFLATRAKFDRSNEPTAELSIENPVEASDIPARSDQQRIQSELEEFFDSYKPHEFATRWRTILEAYSARDYYRLGSPSDVVYAIEKLSDLMKVAHEIYQQLSIEESPNDTPETFTSIGSAHSTIRQFFEARSLEEWERCLRHVLFFALSTDDPDDGGCKEDTLWLYNMVCGLVEGCWEVRKISPT